jgi:hypothetical protein
VLLRQVELALLLEPSASVVLTQGLELGPVLGELLREKRCNGIPLEWGWADEWAAGPESWKTPGGKPVSA